MPLIDMKIPKKSKAELKKMNEPMGYREDEKYPYGLQLRFEKDQVKKLGLKDCKVGDMVNIAALGKVTSVRMSEHTHRDDSHDVEIQIQKIGVEKKKALKDMGMKEYNDARNKGKI